MLSMVLLASVHQAISLIEAAHHIFNEAPDFLGGPDRALGQPAHFARYHGEASPLLTARWYVHAEAWRPKCE